MWMNTIFSDIKWYDKDSNIFDSSPLEEIEIINKNHENNNDNIYFRTETGTYIASLYHIEINREFDSCIYCKFTIWVPENIFYCVYIYSTGDVEIKQHKNS